MNRRRLDFYYKHRDTKIAALRQLNKSFGAGLFTWKQFYPLCYSMTMKAAEHWLQRWRKDGVIRMVTPQKGDVPANYQLLYVGDQLDAYIAKTLLVNRNYLGRIEDALREKFENRLGFNLAEAVVETAYSARCLRRCFGALALRRQLIKYRIGRNCFYSFQTERFNQSFSDTESERIELPAQLFGDAYKRYLTIYGNKVVRNGVINNARVSCEY